eukprot:TRINITY_DN12694_c0_g2_i4.p1 TRINITY_DN12694_c0_g2~~TRINITY_DN12694_c0_g2_i4.p1  ORF type:complete len:386 (+),score=93.73 TRINITY_DN12694_c0_g2_i4:76-1233(+)
MEGNETFESCWTVIKTGALDKLQAYLLSSSPSCSFSRKDYAQIYTTVYNLCTDRQSEYSGVLYQRYCSTVTEYLQQHVIVGLKELHGVSLLIKLKKYWEDYKFMIKWLGKFFNYLDRFHVNITGCPTIAEKGMELFKLIVFNPIKKRVTKGILEEINKSREGEMIDEGLFKATMEIHMELAGKKTVDEDFELAYMETTEAYLKRKASEWLRLPSLEEYVSKVSEYIKAEEERMFKYMKEDAQKRTKDLFNRELLVTNATAILERDKGLPYLLKANLLKQLQALYLLYIGVPNGMGLLIPAFRERIMNDIGEAYQEVILEQADRRYLARFIVDKTAFIGKLLEVVRKYTRMVEEGFMNNGDVKATYHSALSSGLNREIPAVPSHNA